MVEPRHAVWGGAMLAALGLGLTACGDDSAGTSDDTSADTSVGSSAGTSTGTSTPGEAWETLVEGAWELPPSTEGYRCVRTTLERDLAVQVIEPINPPGTHHVLLGIDDEPGVEDGTFPCTAEDVGQQLIYGSGVGTDALRLPEGHAIVLPAGTRLLLNLHLFNSTGSTLTGESGVRVLDAEDEDVVPLEVLLAGTETFTIPPRGESSAVGVCTVSSSGVLAAFMPHMHGLGVQQRVVLRRASGAEQVLHDEPYSFDLQRYVVLDPPLALDAGDAIEVTCTWNNPTDDTVVFGASSRSEMCYAGLLRSRTDGAQITCLE